jgi:ribulose-5-phosphate 4-epimerase/fuculose-1-phosphate aldolase
MATTGAAARRHDISDAEWALRVDVAACYRLIARFGWTDLIYTHVSARVPGRSDLFLLNPYGHLFEEITASSLVVMDMDGNVVHGDFECNEAGFGIHSAVLAARPDILCAAHTHSRAGVGVSCMTSGLMPLTQQAMLFHDRLGYHDWDLQTGNEDECARLAADLGGHPAVILRNHGLLTVGRTVAEAFWYLYNLEVACQFQLDALHAGTELIHPSPDSVARTAAAFHTSNAPKGDLEWRALLRALDRADPSFRQ